MKSLDQKKEAYSSSVITIQGYVSLKKEYDAIDSYVEELEDIAEIANSSIIERLGNNQHDRVIYQMLNPHQLKWRTRCMDDINDIENNEEMNMFRVNNYIYELEKEIIRLNNKEDK